MRFHPLMLTPIGLLLGVAMIACDNDSSRAWIPSHVVIVGEVSHDVEMRRWCEQDEPCELMSRQDVTWLVHPDGYVKVMHIGEELRFERGSFNRPHPHNGDPSWVSGARGKYLLATTHARRALIIHYPIDDN